jgi:hypothetical protein
VGSLLRTLVVWVLGFTISLILGHFVVENFHWWLTHRLGVPRDLNEKRTPPWLTGLLERVFFTIAVAMNATGIAPAMMTWLVLKLAANWQYRDDIPNAADKANYKVSAILTGLLSMLFAYVAGLLIMHWS